MTEVALLRVCGLPGSGWTVAAAPDLFELAGALDAGAERLRADATALAARIGAELVPGPELSTVDRGRALAVRRALHTTGDAPAADLAAVADLADSVRPGPVGAGQSGWVGAGQSGWGGPGQSGPVGAGRSGRVGPGESGRSGPVGAELIGPVGPGAAEPGRAEPPGPVGVGLAGSEPVGLVAAGLAGAAGGEGPLGQALRGLAERQHALAAAVERFDAAVEAAQTGWLGAAWQVVGESATARRAVRAANPLALADIAARLAAGEPWTGKRLRQRADYLWRLATRGSTRATPRGWLGHLALLPIDPAIPAGPLPPLLPEYAIEQAGNLHVAALAGLAADSVLTVAPLHRSGAGQSRFWVVRPEEPSRLIELTVRTTPVLAAIVRALRERPLTTNQLWSEVDGPALPRREVFDGFVRHLVGLGVLAAAARPGWTVHGWRPWPADPLAEPATGPLAESSADSPAGPLAEPLANPSARSLAELPAGPLADPSVGPLAEPLTNPPAEPSADPPAGPLADRSVGPLAELAVEPPAGSLADPSAGLAVEPGGYVDVYRRAAGGLSRATCAELAELVGLALRVLAVLDSEQPRPAAGPDLPDPGPAEPRPLLELVAADVAAEHASDRPLRTEVDPGHHHDWPPVEDPESPPGRLLGWLADRLDAGPVDVDASVLDRSAQLDWPADCLIRPLWPGAAGLREVPDRPGAAGPRAVLDRIEPTGLLDARFGHGLAALFDAGAARAGWYREFLRAVEEAARGRFVELLAPALSDRAANAVRRPLHTSYWTGDPDLLRYCPTPPGPAPRFIPLADITVRQVAGAPVVVAGSEPIWPVYHATRQLPPPWDALARRLLGAGPAPPRSRWRSLRYSLPAWPGRDFVPRITVGAGALVLTCAQWRVRPGDLWPATAPLAAKVRALDRLRRRLELPRWITAATSVHDEPTACDLLSLQAVAVLDRLLRHRVEALYLAEMLPSPPQFPVSDQAAGSGRSQAELLFRLPLGASPTAMAARAAAAYQSRAAPLVPAR